MKATYRRGDIDIRRKRMIIGGIIMLCFALLLIGPVRAVFSRIAYATAPELWEAGNRGQRAFEDFFEAFRSKQALVDENAHLKDELEQLSARVLDRNLLAERVAQFEEIAGRAPVDDRVAGFVLSGPSSLSYDTIAIDVGSDLGVRVGDPVVYTGSLVVGLIAEVYPGSSKVKLVSSPGEEVHVILGHEKIPVVAHGRGLGNFEVTIPTGSSVAVGDEVLLAPGELLLGTIGALETSPTEPVVRVLFHALFNVEDIRSVEVLIGRHHD